MWEYKISASVILFYCDFPMKQDSFRHPVLSFILPVPVGIYIQIGDEISTSFL